MQLDEGQKKSDKSREAKEKSRISQVAKHISILATKAGIEVSTCEPRASTGERLPTKSTQCINFATRSSHVDSLWFRLNIAAGYLAVAAEEAGLHHGRDERACWRCSSTSLWMPGHKLRFSKDEVWLKIGFQPRSSVRVL